MMAEQALIDDHAGDAAATANGTVLNLLQGSSREMQLHTPASPNNLYNRMIAEHVDVEYEEDYFIWICHQEPWEATLTKRDKIGEMISKLSCSVEKLTSHMHDVDEKLLRLHLRFDDAFPSKPKRLSGSGLKRSRTVELAAKQRIISSAGVASSGSDQEKRRSSPRSSRRSSPRSQLPSLLSDAQIAGPRLSDAVQEAGGVSDQLRPEERWSALGSAPPVLDPGPQWSAHGSAPPALDPGPRAAPNTWKGELPLLPPRLKGTNSPSPRTCKETPGSSSSGQQATGKQRWKAAFSASGKA